MTEVSTSVSHAPIWADLSSPDIEGSKAFYGGLFGWDALTVPDPAAGCYTMFLLNGREVAAVGPMPDPNAPPAWMLYIGSENADAVAQRVQEAGGNVITGPFDVMGAGRMAIFQDSNGAFFGVWQPNEHRGFGAVQEPGTFAWGELNSRAMDAAHSFYGHVFGWGARVNPFGDVHYTEWLNDGQSTAGGMPMNSQFPPDVPNHWLVYFAVENAGDAAARAQELGARVLVPPTSVPDVGVFAVLADPQGAVFGILGPR